MEAVRKIVYSLSFLVLLAILFVSTSCNLPVLEFNTQPPEAQTTTVTTTPPPINPSFSAPPLSTSSVVPAVGMPDFVSVIEKVELSVVAINTKVPALSLFGGTFEQEGAGSGWLLDSSGLIVTNNHVVEGANSISVTMNDGRNFSADTVRTDPVSDLAVVKINGQELPPALKVGDSSQLKRGNLVLAIGNSLGQGISATNGIISAMGVSVEVDQGQTLYDLIQTNAAINPGNSGGPLVNMAGEVVGITSIKVAQVGVEGMGYAISTKVALPIINELVTNGYVTRPWLGVGLYTVNQTVVQRYRLAVDKGVLVTEVVDGAPADVAGIKAGDVITKIDDKDVATQDELVLAVRAHKVGESVQATYWRGNSQNTTTIVLGQAPPPS
jgi:serine protease Do